MKRLLLAVVIVALAAAAGGQSFYSGRALGVNPFSSGLIAVGYGQVRVCSSTDIGTNGTPCPDPASISDLNGIPLVVAGGNFGQLKTDILGRYTFQCTSGVNYWVQEAATVSNTPSSSFAITCGGGSGGGGGISRWDQLQNPTNNLSLTMGFQTSFNYNGANGSAFNWNNTAPATAIVSQGSPCLNLNGSFWSSAGGGLSAGDQWQICTLIASATNGNSTLNFAHFGSPGFVAVQVPALILNGANPNVFLAINGVFPLTLPGVGNSAFGFDTDGLFYISENNSAFYGVTAALNSRITCVITPCSTPGLVGGLAFQNGGTQILTIKAASGSVAPNFTFQFPTGQGSTNQCLLSSGPGTPPPWGACALKIGGGTATLGTSAIASNTCAAAVAVSTGAAGVATTDVVSWSFSADPNAVTGYGAGSTGPLQIWAFAGTNAVNFRVCNLTAGSITPGAATLNWRVDR